MFLSTIGLQGQLLYHQDFGGNSFYDDSISTEIFDECKYKQIFNNEDVFRTAHFSIRKIGFHNGKTSSQWYSQSDKTCPNNYAKGYFLQIDGGLREEVFYEIKLQNFFAGDRLRFSFWIVNCYTNYHKWWYEETRAKVFDPEFYFVVLDTGGNEIYREKVGPILVDSYLCGATDYECSADWHYKKISFKLKRNESELTFQLVNDVKNSPGNDFGLDEIKIVRY